VAAQPLSSGLPSGERSMRWWTRSLRLYLARLACACMASVVCSSIACVPRTGHADERFPIPVHVGAAVPGQRWKATRPNLQRGRPAGQVSPRHPYSNNAQRLAPSRGNAGSTSGRRKYPQNHCGGLAYSAVARYTTTCTHHGTHGHAHRRAHTTNAHARTLARSLARSHARTRTRRSTSLITSTLCFYL
jgi:hypothetical protein